MTSPSEPVWRPRGPAWRRLLLVVLASGLALPAAGAPFEAIYPVAPRDGSVLGARPLFQVGYRGVAERDERNLRFRIALSRDGFASEEHVFDQRARRSGWLPGDDGKMIFRPPRPLPDGQYEWRVWAWDGMAWIRGNGAFRLRIDTVPPADVEGLRVWVDPTGSALRLRWEPVTLDQLGGAEFVPRYHVYRYEKRREFPVVRLFEIGVAETPEFTDDDWTDNPSPILYYRVVAEDQAGNIAKQLR